jgi:nucleoside-diphosphate-sugar epimerase
MKRVAVFGASGFVGATLVERLLAGGEWQVVPIVHSSGNAWRIARRALDLASVDLLDEAGVRKVLAGCSHVVNCSRGDEKVMLEGFKALLAAASAERVERFVHLSSVAVYGDPPAAGSEREDAPARPARGTYGWVKLRQDDMLTRAAARGLSAVSLCPPNIGGPYSPYLLAILSGLRGGRIPLVDGGVRPCNLVDVDNLASAIERSLTAGPIDGRRLFITDLQQATWKQVVDELRPVLPTSAPLPGAIAAEELARRVAMTRPPRPSLLRSAKHLMSGDMRAVLRRDPLLARVDAFLRGTVAWLGPGMEDRLRRAVEGPAPIPRPHVGPDMDLRLTSQQLRTVVHSPARAVEELGYSPPHSFEASMRAFRAWYRDMTGLQTGFGDLYARLYS